MPEQQIVIQQNQEDEIVLSLIQQKIVKHSTVRINAAVQLHWEPTGDDATMRKRIVDALRKFVNAEWKFTSVDRRAGQTVRFETVTAQAVVRVPDSENRQLQERASNASTADLQILNAQANYSKPFDEVQKINADLRLALAKQANEECKRYNEALSDYGGSYRVASIEFADTPQFQAKGNAALAGGQFSASNARAGSTYSSGQPPSGEINTEEGGSDLGVNERYWVAAQVTLSRKAT